LSMETVVNEAKYECLLFVLSRLGLDDCFEGVICFETLNPLPKQNGSADGHGNFGDTDGESDSSTDTASCVGGRKSNSKGRRILCKPSLEAVEAAIKIANIDPKRTIFLDDSARNIAAGKAAGLHTVLVSHLLPPSSSSSSCCSYQVRPKLGWMIITCRKLRSHRTHVKLHVGECRLGARCWYQGLMLHWKASTT
ncbi:hypothetical protein B296_00024032, partial [Ensete ventricosum]